MDPHDVRVRDFLVGEPPADVAILGIPFDGAVAGRPGARFAPRAVRDVLLSLYPNCRGVKISREFRVLDLGDVAALRESVELAWGSIMTRVSEVVGCADSHVFIGGDHSVTYPIVSALAKGLRLGLVILDAHLDLRELPPGHISSGVTMHKVLVERKLVQPEHVCYVGVVEWANSSYYLEKAEALGVHVMRANDVRGRCAELAKRIVRELSEAVDAVYISLDVDVVDCCCAPGVNAGVCGGLSPSDVLDFVFEAARHEKTRFLDVVEVCPPFDVGGVTVRLAATAILHFLCGRALALGKAGRI